MRVKNLLIFLFPLLLLVLFSSLVSAVVFTDGVVTTVGNKTVIVLIIVWAETFILIQPLS